MVKTIAILVIVTVLIVIYRIFDPAEIVFFPKCPVFQLTGTKCPGCGSQRAINQLLNGHLIEAFKNNALMVISLPYLAFGFIGQESNKIKNSKVWELLYRNNATIIVLVIVLSYWVLRNLLGF